jgi:hypothetical protein
MEFKIARKITTSPVFDRTVLIQGFFEFDNLCTKTYKKEENFPVAREEDRERSLFLFYVCLLPHCFSLLGPLALLLLLLLYLL